MLNMIGTADLNYEEHSKLVHHFLLYKWLSTCKYSNYRIWGFNQKVMVRIIKAILFSTLCNALCRFSKVYSMQVYSIG